MSYDKQSVSTAFGEVLREVRKEAGVTQADLAAQAGVHVNTISMLERGQRGPALDLVLTLAETLGVGVGELVVRTKMRVREREEP
jgi:transcriptional regulator with XRE-family HTH domain